MSYAEIKNRGGGGFGIVHEVENESGERFARKTLRIPPNIAPSQVTPRFEREVKYQSSIFHPNVVRILEHDLQANPPWFIMPLAICSLQDELDADRHLGGDARTALFDILQGLEEIYRRGFVHRDLKPGNVLKYFDDAGGIYYAVSDFGLMAVGETDTSTLTPSGLGGGTLQYQAPECALNLKRASPQSDIYSFGALLYDIFAPHTARLPHDELTISGDMGAVISKCTKRNPHRRYESVAALREALFEALNTHNFDLENKEAEAIIAPLSGEIFPTDDQWDAIFELLDRNQSSSQEWKAAFHALNSSHILTLSGHDQGLFNALGQMFSKHISDCAFDFDYCDVLASKAWLFFLNGNLGLQAHIALGTLTLGVDHNRWSVERTFLRMVPPDSSDALADRIIVECEVQGYDFSGQYRRLMRSISATPQLIHPRLASLIPA